MKTNVSFFVLGFIMSATANAASYNYDCIPSRYNDGGFDGKLEIEVSSSRLNLKDLKYDLASSGEFDPNYRPTAANAKKVRFEGFSELAGGEALLIRMILDKDMLEGAAKGEMKAQASGEGYMSGTYNCTRK